MSLTKEDWVTLRSMRAEITSALEALGIPIVAWCNDMPEFTVGYIPDWTQIDRVATTVQTKGTREWTEKIRERVAVPEKKAAKRGPKKGRR